MRPYFVEFNPKFGEFGEKPWRVRFQNRAALTRRQQFSAIVSPSKQGVQVMLAFFRNIFRGAEFKQAPISYEFKFALIRADLAKRSTL